MCVSRRKIRIQSSMIAIAVIHLLLITFFSILHDSCTMFGQRTENKYIEGFSSSSSSSFFPECTVHKLCSFFLSSSFTAMSGARPNPKGLIRLMEEMERI